MYIQTCTQLGPPSQLACTWSPGQQVCPNIYRGPGGCLGIIWTPNPSKIILEDVVIKHKIDLFSPQCNSHNIVFRIVCLISMSKYMFMVVI